MASKSTVAKEAENYLVLGVITSNQGQQGVALFKNIATAKTFAVKEGESHMQSFQVRKVLRKTVEILMNGQIYAIAVGGETQNASLAVNTTSFASGDALLSGIEKNGNTLNVSKELKEQLVTNDLSKILMQAAAVPHMIDGVLQGFQLFEIEAKSVFDVAGLKDGDLITAINGHSISDIGATIRQLTALKGASEATFAYVRNGIKQELKINVQ